jgi:hypothetical protein
VSQFRWKLIVGRGTGSTEDATTRTIEEGGVLKEGVSQPAAASSRVVSGCGTYRQWCLLREREKDDWHEEQKDVELSGCHAGRVVKYENMRGLGEGRREEGGGGERGERGGGKEDVGCEQAVE